MLFVAGVCANESISSCTINPRPTSFGERKKKTFSFQAEPNDEAHEIKI